MPLWRGSGGVPHYNIPLRVGAWVGKYCIAYPQADASAWIGVKMIKNIASLFIFVASCNVKLTGMPLTVFFPDSLLTLTTRSKFP